MVVWVIWCTAYYYFFIFCDVAGHDTCYSKQINAATTLDVVHQLKGEQEKTHNSLTGLLRQICLSNIFGSLCYNLPTLCHQRYSM